MKHERRQKSLVLILAREFASNLAMPIYIADADETLVYFNEPAERIAGRSFAETGEMPVRHWTRLLVPRGADGAEREVATTALPLLGPDDEFHGIMVIFWEQG